jgi:hypothetical protein
MPSKTVITCDICGAPGDVYPSFFYLRPELLSDPKLVVDICGVCASPQRLYLCRDHFDSLHKSCIEWLRGLRTIPTVPAPAPNRDYEIKFPTEAAARAFALGLNWTTGSRIKTETQRRDDCWVVKVHEPDDVKAGATSLPDPGDLGGVHEVRFATEGEARTLPWGSTGSMIPPIRPMILRSRVSTG